MRRFRQRAARFLRSTHGHEYASLVDVEKGLIGRQRERTIEAADRVVVAPHPGLGDASLLVQVRGARFQLECIGQILQGVFQGSLPPLYVSRRREDLRTVRFARPGQGELLQSAVVVPVPPVVVTPQCVVRVG